MMTTSEEVSLPGTTRSIDSSVEPVLQVKLRHPKAKLPIRATSGSAGYDIFLPEQLALFEHETKVVDVGLSVSIPQGHVGILASRSSMAAAGITVQGGVCDSDYRGPIKVILANSRNEMRLFPAGHKIAQLLILPYLAPSVQMVDQFDQEITERGEGGFGSSDLKHQ